MPELSLSERRAIAKAAYIYGVPMVDTWKTMYAFSIDTGNPQYKGPFNTVLNIARVFTPDDTAFVTPNSDTPYTFAGLDLRAEPVVITIPKMEEARYFVFQLMDLYTFNFAYIGSRTTGNDGGTFLIAGPEWQGETPAGIHKVLRAETGLVSVVGRTQLFNPSDLDNVKKIQAGYRVQTLSAFLGTALPPAPRAVEWLKPMPPADERTSPEFFNQLAFLLQFALPAHPSEIELRERFAAIGIEPGKPFDLGVLSTDAGHFLFAGPHWEGTPPPGITQVFRAETDIIGTLTRTALNGPQDVPNVKALQSQMRLQPMSAFLGQAAPAPAPPIAFPPYDKTSGSSIGFIAYLNFLLQFAQPPHPAERDMLARFAKIGIGPGKPFNAGALDAATREQLDAGVADAKAALEDRLDKTFTSSGMFGSREELGDDYIMRRDTGAAKGLYGNSDIEAWYGGYVGDGRKPSRVRFPPGQLPPATFFWSATLYTLPDRLLYANPKNRYSIGDRTKGVTTEADGSLILYVGHDSPGTDNESNWLPAPPAAYSLVYRIYGPSQAAIRGEWTLPPLEPVV